ncbi:4'-phosphopantetheinyl transferase [Dyella sp. GSA-30]|nr:4'-phosphopantetheinyl transferase [Dyella sp. GSA-30]
MIDGHSAALHDMRRVSVSTPAGVQLNVYLGGFDIEKFSTTAFAAAGIACPPGVARSVHKRQAEFYFGRWAARQALDALGISAFEVGIGASRQPMWPVDVIGSISHTHAYAAAVALRHGECSGVGIDLEHIAGPDASAALSATTVDAIERRYLETLTHLLPTSALLTAVFSAKESLFKAAFNAVGRYFDFSAASVFLVDLRQGVIRLRLTETLCDAFVCGQVCEIGFCFIEPDVVLTYFAW